MAAVEETKRGSKGAWAGVVVILIIAWLFLLLGVLGIYLHRTLYNQQVFTERITAVLQEPATQTALATELTNVVIVPHIASATRWTREGMATLAACNVAGVLSGYPLWKQPCPLPFLQDDPPRAIPSIVNARGLNMLAG